MSSALRPAVPVSPTTPLAATRLAGVTRRMGAAPSLHVGAAALIVLVGGLLLSIATTTDPLWWQLHFSQLGTFGDLSSAFFNTTLKVSGVIVVFFAFCVRRDVRRLGRGPVRRGAATIAFVCLNVVGVNLALVGCIPLNTDKDLHDRVAGSMVLGFLALLLTAPFLFHRLGKRMAVGTGIATVWLIVSIALFVSATINLALFETIACAAMFAWSGMFTSVLAGAAARTLQPASAADRPAVPHVVRRRVRRPLVARRSSIVRPTAPHATRPTPARRTVQTSIVAVDAPARRSTPLSATREMVTASVLPRGPLIVASGISTGDAMLLGIGDAGRTDPRPSARDLAAVHGDSVVGDESTRRASHLAPRTSGRAASATPRRTPAPRPVSASRAARVGSAGARRPQSRPSTRIQPRHASHAAHGAVRSLLR